MVVIGVSHSCCNSTFSQIPTIKRVSKFKPPLPSSSSSSSSSRTTRAEIQIRVCVNRSCSRQGSRETLETLSGLAPPDVSINSCGCLGRCGAGPNLVVLPEEIMVSHCGTATQAAKVMARICGGDEYDLSKNLTALALRKRGEEESEKKNFSEAELLLSQAIDLKPCGGVHLMYRSRSSARLGMGNNFGALDDAKEALAIAPQYPQGYICQGDAFFAMQDYYAAEESYSSALQIDPSIRRSKSFKARVAMLQEKLSVADVPS